MGFPSTPKRFTVEDLINKWFEYKQECDNAVVKKTYVDAKTHEAYTVDTAAPKTYSIIGFCTFLGMTRRSFYVYYKDAEGENAEQYRQICEAITQECELSARSGFEQGILNPGLAKLWLGRFEDYKDIVESENNNNVVIQPMYGLPPEQSPKQLEAPEETK